jgi:hypothetical protein
MVAEVNMRLLVLALSLCAGFLTCAVPAAGQAAAEAGLGAGASSIGTAGAGGVGKAVGGILRGLDKTIKPADASSSTSVSKAPSRSTAKPRRATPQPPAPPPNYEDAAQIEKGMPLEDLLRRFGPPAMQIANGSETQTMTYLGKSGMVQVELEAGRVVSVAKPKSGA